MLKKRYYILLNLLLLSIGSFAQKDSLGHKKTTLSCNVGYGFPLGDFGLKGGVSTDNPGYANPGLDINFLAKFCSTHTESGLLLMSSFNLNKFDISSYLNPSSLFPRSGPPYFKISNFNESAGNYLQFNLLTGFSIVCYHSNKIALDFRFFIGATYFTYPQISISYLEQYGTTGYTTSIMEVSNSPENSSINPALEIGLSLRYAFNKRINILLSSDMFFSRVTLNYSNGTYHNPDYSVYITDLLLNLNVGIDYRFSL